VAGDREVRLDLYASRAIHLGAGLLGEAAAQRMPTTRCGLLSRSGNKGGEGLYS
jgi:hypothetical protein